MPQEVTKVKKRDGRLVSFKKEKITQAIFKALTITGQGDEKTAKKLSDKVVKVVNRRFKKAEIPEVEQIQDIIEEVLILEDLVETSKSYILYREQRRRIRDTDQIYDEAVEILDKYIDEMDWEVKENSNMAYSLQGLNNYGVSTLTKRYWLNKIYPKQIREAITSGDFHVHDLDVLGVYCCGWDLYDLLKRGFSGVPGKVESKPPKHLRAALGQIVNFFYTLQGEIAGAIAFSNFDTLLAPYVRYDNMEYEDVKQAMQEFLFNCAVPTRVGFQTPFSNITLDMSPAASYAKQPVIIGAELQKETYGEFQEEMNMINKAFYETMMEGDKNGRIFTFPIPTINITNDFPWDDPIVEPMWHATAKYGINYFANFIQSDMTPEDARSMCMDGKEEILIKNSSQIKRLSIKEVAEQYKQDEFDQEGWAQCEKTRNLQVLSLNPKTFKLEWSSVERFLRIRDNQEITITTEDGKYAVFSMKHPMAVYTPQGIQMKFAKDISIGDYLLTLKAGNKDVLSEHYQKLEHNLVLNEDLSKFLGYFTADGNYLFESRKGYAHYGEPRGMQFTFNAQELKHLDLIKTLTKKLFGIEGKEKKDPRYNTYYFYIYNTELARKLYQSGFKKYGRVPQVLFNSPPSVIKAFLELHFKGDGYDKRKEIHMNDLELSRDLVLLYSLIDQPITYKLRKNSQVIRFQFSNSKVKKGNGWLNNPILSERAPGWAAYSTYKVPGLHKARMVGFDVFDKYSAHTEESSKLKEADVYLTRVRSTVTKKHKKPKVFYDLELTKNHLFVHSLGQISFNCCRLRLDNRELYKRGGGLFGANPLTGCYDEQTEILTEQGWKFFKDLTKENSVFTLTEENIVELHSPKKLFEYDYKGEMHQFRTKSLDLLVTPNHRMVIDNIHSHKRKFVEAQDFDVNNQRIPKQSIWSGKETAYFVLPPAELFKGNGPASHFSTDEIESIRSMRGEGSTYLEIGKVFNCNSVTALNICKNINYGRMTMTSYQTQPLRIKMDVWLKFFGFWIAEGCTDNENIAKSHGYRVVISQVNKEKREEIRKVLDELPFNYYVEGRANLVICNKQLWTYLRQFGNKYEKFIPQEIKALSKKQLKILFDWLVKGDGHIRKTTGQINYWTASKKLADDLQEIIMKLGWLGTLSSRKSKVPEIRGRKVKSGIIHTLGVQKAKHYRLRKDNISKVYYEGKVYCCEVKNHTVFVRRNGRVSWCGNSIGVVTINLPRLGYLSKTKKEFLQRLDRLMDLAKESLEIKRKAIEDLIRKGLYPYSRFYLQNVEKMRGSYYGNHFSTIGLLGMNECLLNFTGEDIASENGRKFALEIMDHMRERIIKYQEGTGNLYNLEATPAEGASYKLCLKDTAKYPDIITAGTKEVPYYTNSTQLPVDHTDDIFEALELQDELQRKYTGGTVVHLFLGEKIQNIDSIKALIKRTFSQFKLPYITLTPTFSICPTHGYLAGEHWTCPKCTIEQKCEVYSRVVGYIRPVQQWHEGKAQEFKDRKTFKMRS